MNWLLPLARVIGAGTVAPEVGPMARTHRVQRVLMLVMLGWAVTACHESVGEDGDTSPDGIYLLETLGGRPLPLETERGIGLTIFLESDTLVLERGVSWEIPVTRRRRPGLPDSVIAVGRGTPRAFVRQGERLVFADLGNGPDTATWRAGVLTATTRFPPQTGCATPCLIVFRRR